MDEAIYIGAMYLRRCSKRPDTPLIDEGGMSSRFVYDTAANAGFEYGVSPALSGHTAPWPNPARLGSSLRTGDFRALQGERLDLVRDLIGKDTRDFPANVAHFEANKIDSSHNDLAQRGIAGCMYLDAFRNLAHELDT